ncbi:hypothetical protein MVEN_01643700 [Mycena venus]|uniref:Uncharacterized protein n=1 Tax=Mycena venus TaxID=2733690 RepID=A0A8H6XQW4_9AGAR|nr:hypothetical protein MVEN_01643700 [Mycena venus]
MSSFTELTDPSLQQTFLELFINGLYSGLFFVTMYATVFKRKVHKQSLGILLALLAMYIFSTTHVINGWVLTRNAFIVHGDTALSTVLYLIKPPLSMTVLGPVVFTLNTLVADCVLIWRCWIIWDRNWWIVAVPLGCTVAGAGLGFKSIQELAAYALNQNPDHNKFIDFQPLYFALSLVTTCLATLLIILRIITLSDQPTRKSRGYNLVIEIIVESALLYSVAMAVYLPLLVRPSSNYRYAQAVVAQVTGISPTLIVARVTLGLARPAETWQRSTTKFTTSSANITVARVTTGSGE